jgi:hypothetical protein
MSTTNEPLVSIVTPVYNGEAYLLLLQPLRLLALRSSIGTENLLTGGRSGIRLTGASLPVSPLNSGSATAPVGFRYPSGESRSPRAHASFTRML